MLLLALMVLNGATERLDSMLPPGDHRVLVEFPTGMQKIIILAR